MISKIRPDVEAEIQKRLDQAEVEHGVNVLFAVESGSRAWGFESRNSDYDCRFIYCHSADWYLRLESEKLRDVIEYPIEDDIDINGWDIRKALRLYAKSNPGFIEWIQSPIVYRDTCGFGPRAWSHVQDVYTTKNGIYHYRSSAKSNFNDHLDRGKVKLKRYFYVLRPLLAVKWIEAYGTAPPMEFAKLFPMIETRPDVLEAIKDLLELKRNSDELGTGDPVPVLDEFIVTELGRLDEIQPAQEENPSAWPVLNTLFREVVGL